MFSNTFTPSLANLFFRIFISSKMLLNVQNSNIYNTRAFSTRNLNSGNVSFRGIEKPNDKCMFVYDLDGTLANGSKEHIDKVLEVSKNRNANVVYATGRSIEEFFMLQSELATRGVGLKLPDFLVANNGENLYVKSNNQLYKSFEYSHYIKSNTNFDKAYTAEIIESIDDEIELIETDSMVLKYAVPEDIDIKELSKDIRETLLEENIIVLCGYKAEGTDHQMLYVAPFSKSIAIQYLKSHLEIPYKEILMAGNDNNDISMAKLSKFGSKFICLNNSKPNLIKACERLDEEGRDIYFSPYSGTRGILEGLFKFING